MRVIRLLFIASLVGGALLGCERQAAQDTRVSETLDYLAHFTASTETLLGRAKPRAQNFLQTCFSDSPESRAVVVADLTQAPMLPDLQMIILILVGDDDDSSLTVAGSTGEHTDLSPEAFYKMNHTSLMSQWVALIWRGDIDRVPGAVGARAKATNVPLIKLPRAQFGDLKYIRAAQACPGFERCRFQVETSCQDPKAVLTRDVTTWGTNQLWNTEFSEQLAQRAIARVPDRLLAQCCHNAPLPLFWCVLGANDEQIQVVWADIAFRVTAIELSPTQGDWAPIRVPAGTHVLTIGPHSEIPQGVLRCKTIDAAEVPWPLEKQGAVALLVDDEESLNVERIQMGEGASRY